MSSQCVKRQKCDTAIQDFEWPGVLKVIIISYCDYWCDRCNTSWRGHDGIWCNPKKEFTINTWQWLSTGEYQELQIREDRVRWCIDFLMTVSEGWGVRWKVLPWRSIREQYGNSLPQDETDSWMEDDEPDPICRLCDKAIESPDPVTPIVFIKKDWIDREMAHLMCAQNAKLI